MKVKDFFKGLIRENPIFVLVLGLCPSLAVSDVVFKAIGMSLATVAVLLCSNILISLLKDLIPDEIHIPAYIVIIASFVTVVDMVMHAYFPDLYADLGVFVQLIVVNCIILGRAEAFASKNTVIDSIVDALSMGLGFTFGLTLIALVREVLGKGTITLVDLGDTLIVFNVPVLKNYPISVISASAGALLVMGFLKGFFNILQDKIIPYFEKLFLKSPKKAGGHK